MIKARFKSSNKQNLPRDERLGVGGLMLVYDNNSNEMLGKVVNISTSGVCLIISEDFVKHKKVLVTIPKSSAYSDHPIELELSLVWTKQITSSINYRAGYRFQHLSLKYKRRINELIEIVSKR